MRRADSFTQKAVSLTEEKVTQDAVAKAAAAKGRRSMRRADSFTQKAVSLTEEEETTAPTVAAAQPAEPEEYEHTGSYRQHDDDCWCMMGGGYCNRGGFVWSCCGAVNGGDSCAGKGNQHHTAVSGRSNAGKCQCHLCRAKQLDQEYEEYLKKANAAAVKKPPKSATKVTPKVTPATPPPTKDEQTAIADARESKGMPRTCSSALGWVVKLKFESEVEAGEEPEWDYYSGRVKYIAPNRDDAGKGRITVVTRCDGEQTTVPFGSDRLQWVRAGKEGDGFSEEESSDGEEEDNEPEPKSVATNAAPAAAKAEAAAAQAAMNPDGLKEGDRCEAQADEGSDWAPGKITVCTGDDIMVAFDDGDEVYVERVRAPTT